MRKNYSVLHFRQKGFVSLVKTPIAFPIKINAIQGASTTANSIPAAMRNWGKRISEMLFYIQHILTDDVVVETRCRTETDTWTDADGNPHTDTYQVPYDYYIREVMLENFNHSHVPSYIMSEEQLGIYATHINPLGIRPALLLSSDYIGKHVEGSYHA